MPHLKDRVFCQTVSASLIKGERKMCEFRIDHYIILLKFWKLQIFYRTCSSISSAISHRTTRRFLELVHEENSTVSNSDAILPPTAVTDPVITNVTSHDSLCNCRVLSIQPSRSVSSTSPFWYACLWHLASSSIGESVPLLGQNIVAFHYVSVVIRCLTVCIGQHRVWVAFWEFQIISLSESFILLGRDYNKSFIKALLHKVTCPGSKSTHVTRIFYQGNIIGGTKCRR